MGPDQPSVQHIWVGRVGGVAVTVAQCRMWKEAPVDGGSAARVKGGSGAAGVGEGCGAKDERWWRLRKMGHEQ